MTLGNKLQELRKKRSLSQEAFAEIMSVTRQSVSKWELDQSCPAIEKLVEIADFFDISLDELLRDKEAPADETSPIAGNIDIKDHSSSPKNYNNSFIMYFLWWALLAIIIMIFLGIKEYQAAFVISQVLVWSTVIMRIYSYVKGKKKGTA